MPKPKLQKVEFRSRRAFRDWLQANHDTADCFWLVTFKRRVRALTEAGRMTAAGQAKVDAARNVKAAHPEARGR